MSCEGEESSSCRSTVLQLQCEHNPSLTKSSLIVSGSPRASRNLEQRLKRSLPFHINLARFGFPIAAAGEDEAAARLPGGAAGGVEQGQPGPENANGGDPRHTGSLPGVDALRHQHRGAAQAAAEAERRAEGSHGEATSRLRRQPGNHHRSAAALRCGGQKAQQRAPREGARALGCAPLLHTIQRFSGARLAADPEVAAERGALSAGVRACVRAGCDRWRSMISWRASWRRWTLSWRRWTRPSLRWRRRSGAWKRPRGSSCKGKTT
eukprot:1176683-Prorocentrum_minimum.AAC.1